MASAITSRLPSDPTLEEIEARKTEVHARRLEQLEIDANGLSDEELYEAHLEASRLRSRQWRKEKKAKAPTFAPPQESVVAKTPQPIARPNWGLNIANELLHQSEETEPLDLPLQYLALNHDHTPSITVCGKVPVPEGGPRDMTPEERRGFSMGSLIELNRGLDRAAREARYTLGDVDPEVVDLEPGALADYRESIAQPCPPLKTETAWKKTHRDVVAFRSKRK